MGETIFLGVLVALAIGLIIFAFMPSKKEGKEQVMRRMAGKRAMPGQEGSLVQSENTSSAAKQMLEKIAPYAMKPVMPKSEEEMSTLRQKLSQGGFRRENATRYFLASKTIGGGILALLALFVSLGMTLEPKILFGVVTFAGGVGFMFPNLWLAIARSQRIEKVRNALPDSLDLLVVSVESGLGLDASLQRVSDEMHIAHPELSEEMQIATLETQMGVPRAEALENMGRRCGVAEMKSLVAVISQAEKFGTSVARALRNQADVLRVKRRQRAEERAQKTTVKLMLPLIFFIFPSIFVVLLGPAAMKIYDQFMTNPAFAG